MASRMRQRASSAWSTLREPSEYDPQIFEMALPTLGAVLVDPVLSMVDTLFVGQLGMIALGAIGPCTAIFNFVFATASSVFMVSTSVLISRYQAAGDMDSVGRILTLAAGTALALGTVAMIAFMATPASYLRFMGAPPALMADAVPYLWWRALAMPANMFLLVAAGAFRGSGRPQITLRSGMIVGLVNAVLDPILMFPLGLRTAGAAIATAIAQWIGAFWYVGVLWENRKHLGITHLGRNLIPRREDWSDFAGAGSALLLRQLCNVGAWTFMSSAATRMGVITIAAHQAILSLWLVIAFAQDALGVSGQVLVARQLSVAVDGEALTATTSDPTATSPADGPNGATAAAAAASKPPPLRDLSSCQLTARSVAKRVLALSFLMGVVLSGVLLLALPLILPALCESVEVQAVVAREFPFVLKAFPLCCVVWTWDSLFYGASDFVYQAKTIAVGSAVGVAGIFASLRLGLGLRGIWTAMIYFYFGLRAIAHFMRFNSNSGPFGKGSAALEGRIAALAAARASRSPAAAATN